jgi:hypothetical protein
MAAFPAPEKYAVLRGDGNELVSGTFGKPVTLPPGNYILRTVVLGRLFRQPFSIVAGRTTDVLFDVTAWNDRLYEGSAVYEVKDAEPASLEAHHPMYWACSATQQLRTKNAHAYFGVGFGPKASAKDDEEYQFFNAAQDQLLTFTLKGERSAQGVTKGTDSVNGIEFDVISGAFEGGRQVMVCIGVQQGRCVAYWFAGSTSMFGILRETFGTAKCQ